MVGLRLWCAILQGLPPLVFAGECDQLKERLAAVARGEAFLLQGGDCAETFAGTNRRRHRGKALDAAADGSGAYLCGQRATVVKVGRMAGQFAKPQVGGD